MGSLVLEAAPPDQVKLRVVPDWSFDSARGSVELECHEVIAGEIADKISGADDDVSVDELHAQTLPATRVS